MFLKHPCKFAEFSGIQLSHVYFTALCSNCFITALSPDDIPVVDQFSLHVKLLSLEIFCNVLRNKKLQYRNALDLFVQRFGNDLKFSLLR